MDIAIWQVVLRTVIVYVAVLIGLRLSGKREIGQMAVYDLVLLLLLANAVQNAMVGPDTSLGGGLLAAAVLLFLNGGLARLRLRWPGCAACLKARRRCSFYVAKFSPKTLGTRA